MKGHLPFAFVIPSASTPNDLPATPSKEFFTAINNIVRTQIGNIASLGGIIQGKGMIPKTRSGKTLRRVLRELVENAAEGNYDKEVNVPATVEDKEVVEVARSFPMERSARRTIVLTGTSRPATATRWP